MSNGEMFFAFIILCILGIYFIANGIVSIKKGKVNPGISFNGEKIIPKKGDKVFDSSYKLWVNLYLIFGIVFLFIGILFLMMSLF